MIEQKEMDVFWPVSRCLEGGRVSSNHLDNFRQFMENEQREAFRRKRTDFHIYSKDDVDM
jgi:hypothetical protein